MMRINPIPKIGQMMDEIHREIMIAVPDLLSAVLE